MGVLIDQHFFADASDKSHPGYPADLKMTGNWVSTVGGVIRKTASGYDARTSAGKITTHKDRYSAERHLEKEEYSLLKGRSDDSGDNLEPAAVTSFQVGQNFSDKLGLATEKMMDCSKRLDALECSKADAQRLSQREAEKLIGTQYWRSIKSNKRYDLDLFEGINECAGWFAVDGGGSFGMFKSKSEALAKFERVLDVNKR